MPYIVACADRYVRIRGIVGINIQRVAHPARSAASTRPSTTALCDGPFESITHIETIVSSHCSPVPTHPMSTESISTTSRGITAPPWPTSSNTVKSTYTVRRGAPTGIFQVFGISEQDSGGQLIVQEAAFDESCFGDVETRFDSNIIAHIHTKSARFRRRVRLGVQQQLQRIEGALCFEYSPFTCTEAFSS